MSQESSHQKEYGLLTSDEKNYVNKPRTRAGIYNFRFQIERNGCYL